MTIGAGYYDFLSMKVAPVSRHRTFCCRSQNEDQASDRDGDYARILASASRRAATHRAMHLEEELAKTWPKLDFESRI